MAKISRKTSEKAVNGRDNGRKGGIDNLTPGNPATQFTSENQPSPEAKIAGHERKRGAEAILDAFQRYSAMPMSDLQKLMQKIQAGDYTDLKGRDLTPADIHAIRHATDKKHTVDYMNRGVSYAKQSHEIEGGIVDGLLAIVRGEDK